MTKEGKEMKEGGNGRRGNGTGRWGMNGENGEASMGMDMHERAGDVWAPVGAKATRMCHI